MDRRERTDGRGRSACYSSRIIKAGALIGDTKPLLAHWHQGATVEDNLELAQRDNVFGKASRSRVEDILRILRQRYLAEDSVTKALATLVQCKFPSTALDRVLYFHSARADQLLRDTVTEIIVPMRERGIVDVDAAELHRKLDTSCWRRTAGRDHLPAHSAQERVDPVFFSDPMTAAMKALGMN